MSVIFSHLNLVSLNVKGIRNLVKRKAIFIYCRRTKADIIFLQETHSSKTDINFWKSQWGDQIVFSHGSNHSAGVAVLFNNFKGDIIESFSSEDGRWIIIVCKLDNSLFILCNVYGHNTSTIAKGMFTNLSIKIKLLQDKFKDAFLIIGGDFNDAPDDLIDRIPIRTGHQRFKASTFLIQNFALVDVWRILYPDVRDYTWSNNRSSLRSRIDLWLTSSNCIEYTTESAISHAPLSDHKAITLNLNGSKAKTKMSFRGYWKFNNSLLSDDNFNETVKQSALEIFNRDNLNPIQKWEFFKFKVRELAIKRSKEINKLKTAEENQLNEELDVLLNKDDLTEDDQIKIRNIHSKLDDMYIKMAKGAFIRSRAKWLEEGERNTNYFFSLEKRNQKRNNICSLKINNNVTNDQTEISQHVYAFYKELYTSKFKPHNCEVFIKSISKDIKAISEDYKHCCDAELQLSEMNDTISSMKKGKSPGTDGLSVEFYLHFWEIIKIPLFEMYKECLKREELSTTMKQGLITLLPKSNKDKLLVENWRPISLLNVDYKLLSLLLAKRFKTGLNDIINEIQTGFMKGRHISNNIRLVLDLLEYPEYIEPGAILVFLDFYKAFDTIEHQFLFQALQCYGFGNKFISMIKTLYNDVNSNVLLFPFTTQRFPVQRSVRQGCPLSAFLFLIVTELLATSLLKSKEFDGICVFNREIRVTQLADDTVLFLKNKYQIKHAFELINKFSEASGLCLNISKCEILPIHNIPDKIINDIPVKNSVKYLGIQIDGNESSRQELNFMPKIKKNKMIFNMWLQRDLSIIGRVLLTKAEGVSRLVYPALSLPVHESTCKEINQMFTHFIWKNKQHYLKKEIICNKISRGGLEMLDFNLMNNSFKVKWIKKYLENPESIWFCIPHNIFKQIGGLKFVLSCNFNVTKLPLKLSLFHQQVLMAWKLCYIHNFSPHKTIIWNNENITVNNKSIYFQNWIDKGIIFLEQFFINGNSLSYEILIKRHRFNVTHESFNEFCVLAKAIPSGYRQLMKSPNNSGKERTLDLYIGNTLIQSSKCNNIIIRESFNMNKTTPKGKFVWNSVLSNINWENAWMLPYKFCLNNKIKELQFKILHNIYPSNYKISKYVLIDSKCDMCSKDKETLIHLFYCCEFSLKMWMDFELFLFTVTKKHITIDCKTVIIGSEYQENVINKFINIMILLGKFHIHKSKVQNSKPSFKVLLYEYKSYIESLKHCNNKKALLTLDMHDLLELHDKF